MLVDPSAAVSVDEGVQSGAGSFNIECDLSSSAFSRIEDKASSAGSFSIKMIYHLSVPVWLSCWKGVPDLGIDTHSTGSLSTKVRDKT